MAEKTLQEISAENIHRIAHYWQGKTEAGRMPGRQDIHPADLPGAILPWIILTELHDQPLRARFRLVGTGIAELQGDFTGAWADEMQSDSWLDKWMDQYRRLIASRRPLFGIEKINWHDTPYCTFEWGLFPLSSDGKKVDMVLEIEDHPKRAKVAANPELATVRGLPFGTQPKFS